MQMVGVVTVVVCQCVKPFSEYAKPDLELASRGSLSAPETLYRDFLGLDISSLSTQVTKSKSPIRPWGVIEKKSRASQYNLWKSKSLLRLRICHHGQQTGEDGTLMLVCVFLI